MSKKKHQAGWGCIYSVINLADDKEYIGKDKIGDPANHRWKEHIKDALKAKSSSYFQRAVKSAGGPAKFKWTVIWRGPAELLNEKEIYYIKKRHAFIDDPKGGGYNLTRCVQAGIVKRCAYALSVERSIVCQLYPLRLRYREGAKNDLI